MKSREDPRAIKTGKSRKKLTELRQKARDRKLQARATELRLELRGKGWNQSG